MADRKVEDYKKSILKCVDKWGQEHAKCAGQVAEIVKQIEALTKQANAVRSKTMDASRDLGLAIMGLKVPADADEKELAKVPTIVEQLIMSKAESNKQFIRYSPNPNFNSKTKTLTVTATYFFHATFEKLE